MIAPPLMQAKVALKNAYVKSLFAFFILLILSFSITTNAQKIFPNAEGYGQHTKGGRGGTIIRVTNLNNSGAGSFRAALEASGPRTVVFEVSGTIKLNGTIVIKNPYLTIAGQSAPSPGILIRGGTITIKAHDVLVQHIRVRLGNVSDDCMKISTAGISGDVYNVYLDHVSLSWANDENLSFFQRDGLIRDISISHCIISEALAKNNTFQNSKGFLITKDSNGSGSDEVGDFSITKSLFASNNQRNPEMVNGSKAISVNNVTYGYRHSALAIGNSTGQFKVANVNNVYKTRVPASKPPIYLRAGATGQLYMANNMLDGNITAQSALISKSYTLQASSPMNLSVVSIIPTTETMDYVMTYVGARPVDRDAVDARIINEVKTKTGDWMDKTEVEGKFPFLAANNRAFNISNPNGDDDGDGYTNLEEMLYQMKLEVEGLDTTPEPENNPPTISNIANQTIDQDATLSGVSFTIGDDKTATSALTISGQSSNSTLAADGDITFSGSGANRSLSIVPNAGQFGTTQITVTVSDGEKTTNETFTLTVNEKGITPEPNNPPTISSIADVTINQDEITSDLPFTVGDDKTALADLSVSGASSNTTLVTNGNIIFDGSGKDRIVRVTPNLGQFGTTQITISVSDGEKSATEIFTLTVKEKEVTPVPNNPPTISNIANQIIDQGETLSGVSFTVSDDKTAAASLTVTGQSSNLILVGNGDISFGGSGANRTLNITPNAGQFGTTEVTITVSDGEKTAVESFSLTVNEKIITPEPNSPPTISSIGNYLIAVNTTLEGVSFTVGDDKTPAGQLQVFGTSSNQNLVANNDIKIQGSNGNKTLVISPKNDQYGKVRITLTVSDGEYEVSEDFILSVKPQRRGKYALNLKNYPNPFKENTTIEYTLKENSKVDLKIYDMTGVLLNQLVHEKQAAGTHSINWNRSTRNGNTVQDGLYTYKLTVNGLVHMGRMYIRH